MVCEGWAKMAAEIATMRVSNQIDALETLSTHNAIYNFNKTLASIVAVPFLVLIKHHWCFWRIYSCNF